ncbi:hypothetical protein PPROV_001031200 [Pycnococcus provasolii]|uniref:RAVE complex protein Rav1 C-terminal domain-containing protein n=1 Tax=Pycnococcus provasolii TaxID=41880 RepID=A0A830HWN2_9CHLO|nr:hypothetical protein PPROV_001031200 [Pycnococcus provasolii]
MAPPWTPAYVLESLFMRDLIFPRLALRLMQARLNASTEWTATFSEQARAPLLDTPPAQDLPLDSSEGLEMIDLIAMRCPPSDSVAAGLAVAYGRLITFAIDGEQPNTQLDEHARFVHVSVRARACSPTESSRRITPKEASIARRSSSIVALMDVLVDGDGDGATMLERLRLGEWAPRAKLVAVCETAAKQAFASSKDPEKCALLYVALGKHKILGGLYKATGNKAVGTFLMTRDFANNESDRDAASKNALALMSKQRYELAAAFLVLAGSPGDACDVLARRADRLSLAISLLRLLVGADERLPEWAERFLLDERHDARSTIRSLHAWLTDSNYGDAGDDARTAAYTFQSSEVSGKDVHWWS